MTHADIIREIGDQFLWERIITEDGWGQIVNDLGQPKAYATNINEGRVQTKIVTIDTREHGRVFAIASAWFTHDDILLENHLTLLIPDRDRDNQDDFVWCLPAEHEKWAKWAGLADKFKGITPEAHGSMRYANRMEGGQVRTVLVLPEARHSDDDVIHACAFLRMAKGITCRIFVLRSTEHVPPNKEL